MDKAEEARALGLDEPRGLLITSVLQGSPAAEGDVRPGDVVLEVNQKEVASVDAFRKIVTSEGEKKGVVMLLIKRQGRNIFRTVSLSNQ